MQFSRGREVSCPACFIAKRLEKTFVWVEILRKSDLLA
jgi:hypothetical protein